MYRFDDVIEEGRLDAVDVVDTAMILSGILALAGLGSLAYILARRRGGEDDAPELEPDAEPDTTPVDTAPVETGTPGAPAPEPAPTPEPTSVASEPPSAPPAPTSPAPTPPTSSSSIIRNDVRSTWASWSAGFEGRTPTMYQDVKGLVTTGVGNLIDPIALAKALPWLKPDGTAATQDEVVTEWNRVKAMSPGLYWTKYQSPDGLHLSDATIDALVLRQLDQNAVVLQRFFPDFANYPEGVQRAILSIAWAVGAGFPPKWPKFTAAVKARDWTTAAQEGTLSTAGNPGVAKRNEANKAALLSAVGVA